MVIAGFLQIRINYNVYKDRHSLYHLNVHYPFNLLIIYIHLTRWETPAAE